MMTFTSKKDVWMGIWIWTFMVFGLGASVFSRSLVFTIIMAVVILIMGWFWWGTAYYITENDLKIKCGPITQVIPLDEIKSIKKSRSYLAASALSFDRLEIIHGNFDVTLISPENQDAFIQQMKGRMK